MILYAAQRKSDGYLLPRFRLTESSALVGLSRRTWRAVRVKVSVVKPRKATK